MRATVVLRNVARIYHALNGRENVNLFLFIRWYLVNLALVPDVTHVVDYEVDFIGDIHYLSSKGYYLPGYVNGNRFVCGIASPVCDYDFIDMFSPRQRFPWLVGNSRSGLVIIGRDSPTV